MNTFAIIFGIVNLLIVHAEQKLNVTILFESLCPDSVRLVKQLASSWSLLEPHVNVKFVPFGKSSSRDGGSRFVCQHGPRECAGNKIISCALIQIWDQTAQVDYVNCFMSVYQRSKHNDREFGQNCVQRLGLDWETVRQCYESPTGTILQLQAERDTVRFAPKFIPTVLYNGIFDQRLQDASIVNFKDVICSLTDQSKLGLY